MIASEVKLGLVRGGLVSGDLRLGLGDGCIGRLNRGPRYDDARVTLLLARGCGLLNEVHVGLGLPGLGHRGVQVAFGLFELCLQRGRIEFDQWVARLHELVVIHKHSDHVAGDARTDFDNVAIEEGVVGFLVMPRVEVPDDRGDRAHSRNDADDENYRPSMPIGGLF